MILVYYNCSDRIVLAVLLIKELIKINRLVLGVQGGYFFLISSIIALTAVKTITNVSKIIMSFIPISTPFTNKICRDWVQNNRRYSVTTRDIIS